MGNSVSAGGADVALVLTVRRRMGKIIAMTVWKGSWQVLVVVDVPVISKGG